MGNALILKAPATLSAPGTAPKLIHSIPVAGYSRRYVAKAIPQTIGSNVASWIDLAGSGQPLVQATTAAQPTLQTVTGKPAVVFDGVDDLLQAALFASVAPCTITTRAIMRAKPTGISGLFWQYFGVSSGSSLYIDFSYNLKAYGDAIMGAGTSDATEHTLTLVYNGASSLVVVDAAAALTGNTGNVSADRLSLANISGSNAAANPNKAPLTTRELICWPTALTSTQVASVHTALATAYA